MEIRLNGVINRTVKVSVKKAFTSKLFARIGSNFIWSLISEATAKSIFFITTIYLARVLGVRNFGLFIIAQTITFYFWIAVDLGINMYGIREISKNKDELEKIVNPLMGLRLVAGIIGFILLNIFLYFSNFSDNQKFISFGCSIYLLSYALYADWVLKGLEMFQFVAFGSFVSSLFFLIASVCLVKSSHNVITAAIIWSSSYFLGTFVLYITLRRLGIRIYPEIAFSKWVKNLKESMPLSLAGITMIGYQYLPIFLLTMFYTSYEVGIFAAPYRLVITLCSAGFLIPMAFYPFFSESYKKDYKGFYIIQKKLQGIMLFLGVPIGIIGYFGGEQIIAILLGEQYKSSVVIFKIQIWLVVLYYIRYTYGTTLISSGFQRWYILLGIFAIISAFVLCFGLMNIDPIIGVSIGIVLAEILLIIAFMKISKLTFLKNRST